MHDHQINSVLSISCHSFHDIPVMKSFIKILAEPELTEGCFVSLTGPVGRRGIAIDSFWRVRYNLHKARRCRLVSVDMRDRLG